MKARDTGSRKSDDLGLSSSQTLLNGNQKAAIQSLLESSARTVDDKVAKVKAAHYVDKDRFQNAFLALMGKQKLK